jgi:succinate dehydrogenase / fumarate reductase flavoprotein subunit
MVPGSLNSYNPELDKAHRVADFIELGRLMVWDALTREESCGGHFRVEHQTPEGEALRHDEEFAFVSAWAYQGPGADPVMHREALNFEAVHLSQRSYK